MKKPHPEKGLTDDDDLDLHMVLSEYLAPRAEGQIPGENLTINELAQFHGDRRIAPK